jgi:hypothetical protein
MRENCVFAFIPAVAEGRADEKTKHIVRHRSHFCVIPEMMSYYFNAFILCNNSVIFGFLFTSRSRIPDLVSLGMDKLLKKDVGQSANHATSNTPWVSGWPDLLHKHNTNKTQCNFVNNAHITVIFVPFNLDSRVT